MSERRVFDKAIAAVDRVLEHWALVESDPRAARELAAKAEEFEASLLAFLESPEAQAQGAEVARRRQIVERTLSKIAKFRAKLAGQASPI